MSANIAIDSQGNHQAIYGENTPAWHGLGKVVEGLLTWLQVISETGMDKMQPKKIPMYIANQFYNASLPISETNKKGFAVPDQYAVIRQDKIGPDSVLGYVGNQYEILPIDKMFTFFDGLIESGEAIYESAGVLGKGEKVWVLARLPENIVVRNRNGKSEEIRTYILLLNSFDGSTCYVCKFTNVRVVCENTVAAALHGEGESVKFRHTISIEGKIKYASDALNLAKKNAVKTQEAYNYLAGMPFDTTMLNYFLTVCFPHSKTAKSHTKTNNVRESITELFESTGTGIDLAGSTAWGAVNAVTEYVSHVKDYKNKLESVWLGNGDRLIKTAFNTALNIETIQPSEMQSAIDRGYIA